MFSSIIDTFKDLQLSINANTSMYDAYRVADLIRESTDAIIEHNRTLIRYLKQQQEEIKF